MARITVEDCLDHISNRFALVLIAAQRSKELMKGDAAFVQNDKGNKEIVTSLREVAEGFVSADESGFDRNVQQMVMEVNKNNKEAGYSLPPSADDV